MKRAKQIFLKKGDKIDMLTLLARSGEYASGTYSTKVWQCICDCGKICYKTSRALQKRGTKKHCGCQQYKPTFVTTPNGFRVRVK